MWYVQLLLSYAGNSTTGDYKCDFSFPSASGWYDYVGDNTTADAINVSTGIQMVTLTNFAAPIGLGTDAASTPRMFSLEMMIRPTAAGTVQFRFANNTAGAGVNSITKVGSILRAKKLA